MQKLKIRLVTFPILLFLILWAIIFYVLCPAINIHLPGFWIILIATFVVCALFTYLLMVHYNTSYNLSCSTPAKVWAFGAGGLLVIFLILMLISSPLFQSKAYRDRITVNEKDEAAFIADIPTTKEISKISLMDTTSASKLGDRVLGTLSDVVSQFEMGSYATIELNGDIMKVAPLKYGDFFKWCSNSDTGIPGYVLVNPVTSEAKFVAVEGGIHYAPSAFFNKDLIRHVRMKYPTKVFGEPTFQIDNEGNPFWLIPTLKFNTVLECSIPEGAIMCNATTGKCEYYSIAELPEYADLVFSGTMVEELYDSHGKYINGFFNFSKKGITMTTDDYGYLCVGSDIYIYTGITSIAADESNLGFILVNSRTGEFNYYTMAGAEEYSAMSAAAGAVQNYGYTASFPSLVNIDGVPTYVMVLKDSNDLIKMYALVNVKNYTIVAVSETLEKCISNYKEALVNAGTSGNIDINDTELIKNASLTITDIQYINVNGNTIVYIKGDNNKIYKQAFADNENLIFLNVGDTIKVSYYNEDTIITIHSFEKWKPVELE